MRNYAAMFAASGALKCAHLANTASSPRLHLRAQKYGQGAKGSERAPPGWKGYRDTEAEGMEHPYDVEV